MTRIIWTAGAALLVAAATAQAQQPVKVKETEKGLAAKARISSDSAIAIARARVPHGTISEAELEREKGKIIYSFDMKVPGKTGIDEVNVDAVTGAATVSHESPADEKAEAKADARAKAKKKP
ncbi:MAG TPA: PepSY domain-containing protein [Gemmatimonadaceae bacterium]|jgi:uncharacterized membrane protein YkoI|nr:PepSY domain-containing protein [Gemmatimonadaceae bacterium]